jgi:cell division protein FtsQ
MPAAVPARPRPRAAAARTRPVRLAALRTVAGRIAPSWRSLAVGVSLLLIGGGLFAAARETSMFAVRTIEIEGATPRVAAQVQTALAPLAGRSLLKVGPTDVDRRLNGLSTVASATTDRDFPHTLRVRVSVEQPLAVVRQGAAAWLVAADDRVIRPLVHPARSALPRIWLPKSSSVTAGATLVDELGARATAALRAVHEQPLGSPVRDVVVGQNQLTLRLARGLELRLGDTSNLRFKLAVADRIVRQLTPRGYLDVSVPQRAVARDNSQVSG